MGNTAEFDLVLNDKCGFRAENFTSNLIEFSPNPQSRISFQTGYDHLIGRS